MGKSILKWAKTVGAKITDYPDNIQIIEHDDGNCFRRYHLKNGMIHNDNGSAIHTEYDGNVSDYWWLNDRPCNDFNNSSLPIEHHLLNHKWDYVNGKAIKIKLESAETHVVF